MQTFYENEETIELTPAVLREGLYVAVKFSGKEWYRAKIESLINSAHPEVFCSLVDYGNTTQVELKYVQPLFHQFRNLPRQAIKARLHG